MQARAALVKPPSVASKSNEYIKTQARPNTIVYDGLYAPVDGAPTTIAPPVHIFHPIFQQFTREANDSTIVPPDDMLKMVQDFMYCVCEISSGELGSNAKIRPLLSKILKLAIHSEPNDDNSSADAVFMMDLDGIRFPVLLVELKRVLGEGGCDPSIQAGNSMRQALKQANVSSLLMLNRPLSHHSLAFKHR